MGNENVTCRSNDLGGVSLEKKIIIFIQANGQIKIEFPNDLSLMENVGVLEASKTILLNQYINPKQD